MTTREKRQRKFRVTPEFLDQIFTAKTNERGDLFKGITSDLPDDTRIVWIGQSRTVPADWLFVCEHESFDLVPEGGDPPELTPTFTAHYDEPVTSEVEHALFHASTCEDIGCDDCRRLTASALAKITS